MTLKLADAPVSTRFVRVLDDRIFEHLRRARSRTTCGTAWDTPSAKFKAGTLDAAGTFTDASPSGAAGDERA